MKTIVLIVLCLIPTVAFGDGLVKLHFKDKSTPFCGDYTRDGNKYCKQVSGGTMCVSAEDVANVEKVDGCEDGGFATGGNATTTTSASTAQNQAPERTEKVRKELDEIHRTRTIK